MAPQDTHLGAEGRTQHARDAAAAPKPWTGYLGGAVATHVRLGNPLFTHLLFPVFVGGLLWLGLWLRDARLRALVPFTNR